MDILDRYQEEIERRQALHAKGKPLTAAVRSAALADREQKVRHQITIIGCIRGVDGWYRCGFDEERKQIVPLEQIETCTTAVRSAPLADEATASTSAVRSASLADKENRGA